MAKKLKLKTQWWSHECGDRCCFTTGTDIFINDVKVSNGDDDNIHLILTDVLQSLGYEIKIEYCDD